MTAFCQATIFQPLACSEKYASALVVGCSHRLIYICSQHELFSVCLLDSVDPVRLVLEEQSDPALHCLLYALSLGCSHRLYAYAHGILFLRVFR